MFIFHYISSLTELHTFITLRLQGEGWEKFLQKFNMTKDGEVVYVIFTFTPLPFFNNHFYDNEKHFWVPLYVHIFISAWYKESLPVQVLFERITEFVQRHAKTLLIFSPIHNLAHKSPIVCHIKAYIIIYVRQVLYACVRVLMKKSFYAYTTCAFFSSPSHISFTCLLQFSLSTCISAFYVHSH